MSGHPTDFSQGKVSRCILELAVPMTLAQMVSLLYNIVDRMYIGRIPGGGDLALTGLGICFPIIMILTAFANLYGMGGAPLFSIERGAGNEEEAGRLMSTSFALLCITGIVLMTVCLLFLRPLLYLFGASDVTYPFARDYAAIYLCGTLFVMISLGMNGFINAQGFGRIGMMTSVLGAAVNIVLDPILIFHLEMGVKGAALATVVSQSLSAAWVFFFLTGRRTLLRISPAGMRPKLSRIRRIVALGLSGFVMQATNSAVQIACNQTLQQFGGDLYVGVMTVMTSIREIFNMPVLGLTNAAQPVISFNYGARAYGRVRQAIAFISVCCVMSCLFFWLLIIRFPVFFVTLFNDEPAMVNASVDAVPIYFFGLFLMALQSAGQSVFVATGKAKRAVFFSVFRKLIIVVPLTLILPHFLGLNGIFLAEPVSNLVGGAACYLTMLGSILPELKKGEAMVEKWVLGITGGIGSGKSAILQILEQKYGAQVIQADQVAHEQMEPGKACYESVVAAFGSQILKPDGTIDRPALGRIVFSGEDKRILLNRLTHPEVKNEIRRRIADSRAPFVVVEAALLLEEHYDEICQEIWYVYADRQIRIKRLTENRGYSGEQALAIMQRQLSEEEFTRRCQAVIDNNGSIQETEEKLRQLLADRAPSFLRKQLILSEL